MDCRKYANILENNKNIIKEILKKRGWNKIMITKINLMSIIVSYWNKIKVIKRPFIVHIWIIIKICGET